jgi:hypothetical protein
MSNSLSLAFLAQDVLITVMSYLGIGDVLRIRSVSEHVYVLILLFLSQADESNSSRRLDIVLNAQPHVPFVARSVVSTHTHCSRVLPSRGQPCRAFGALWLLLQASDMQILVRSNKR